MKVCPQCFNDLELKQFIASNSAERGICDYCSDETTTDLIEIEELLDFFAEFFSIFKEVTDGTPLVELIQQDWDLFSDKPENIALLAKILETLNLPFANLYSEVSYIDEITECTSYWEVLKESIKWERRFLIDIDKLEDLGWDRFFEQQVKLPVSESLFRARLHYQGDQSIFDQTEMGSPHKTKVEEGRANPLGIPYLYLSTSIETTLYEIRAFYLDEVSVGEFKIKEASDIILVDFTYSTGAFFNVGRILDYTKSMLLKELISADLSKPMRRYDSKLEYIPTQFICEFIRYITNADGIQFNSSLHIGGKNIVLFAQDKVECTSVAMHRVTKVEIKAQKE